MSKRPKKMDLNQLAKRIVDEATGEVPITPSPEENKRLAKQKAANARANKLTEEQRKEIAKKASHSRKKLKQDEGDSSSLPAKKTQIIA